MKTSGIKKNIHKAVDKIDDESLPENVHSFPEIQLTASDGLRRTSFRVPVKKILTGY
ncbi:MAG: hypothetical protein JWM28_2705 [Chitinophagaceae bacterium]|nr:hypothetical protein [Chitinophagaceae bacterium]